MCNNFWKEDLMGYTVYSFLLELEFLLGGHSKASLSKDVMSCQLLLVNLMN